MLSIRRVTIRGNAVFVCSVCCVVGYGSEVVLELNSLDLAEISRATRNLPLSHIPTGWAAYGSNDVRCEQHAHAERGHVCED